LKSRDDSSSASRNQRSPARLSPTKGYLGWVNGLRLRVRVIVDRSGQRTAVLTRKGRRQDICREE
jgi:hypothetical protein